MPLIRYITVVLLVGFTSITGCGGGGNQNGSQGLAAFSITNIDLNPLNELSTLVTFESNDAAFARVFYWAGNETPQATPIYPIQPGLNTIATLGLRPSTLYRHIVEISGPDGIIESEEALFSSGEIPQILSVVGLETVGNSSPGYTMTAVNLPNNTACVVAFDNTGNLSWYRCFEEGLPPRETKQQPNGNFTIFLGTTQGWQPVEGRFIEFSPSGELIQTFEADAPFFTDNHEILFSVNGSEVDSAYFFGYELRTTDLSLFGGITDAQVAGHLIVRQSSAGVKEIVWNAWDHLSVADWIEPPDEFKLRPNIDFDHPNSLDFDQDGNYVVSFRNLGEITKIDAATGGIIWRFGGVNNQFTILNDPFGGFSGQHSARVLDNGNILLFDNGPRHTPPESRAVEYALDLSTNTATMVWEFRHSPPINTIFVGAAQRLANGDTLVSFGGDGHVDQVSPDGTVVWEGDLVLDNLVTAFYRAVRIHSLYEFQRP